MNNVVSKDQQFVARLREIVLANLSNENFDVELMAREMCISRSSVHRRLKHLTNQNATHFIREIRLQRALEILLNDHSTAAEVAYRVGFGSPAYFTRCFHEYYGYPPGEARKRFRYEEAESILISWEEKKISASQTLSRQELVKIISAVASMIISLVLLLILAPREKHLERREKILGRRVKYLSDVMSNLVC